MARILKFIVNDKWIDRAMMCFVLFAVVMLFVRADSLAESVVFGICMTLLSVCILRGAYICWCVNSGKGIASEPKAAVRRRERIGDWIGAVFFVTLLALALWKWFAGLWA